MEIKKTVKADLSKKRVIFLEIGLTVTLFLVLLAFEYKVKSHDSNFLIIKDNGFLDEELQN